MSKPKLYVLLTNQSALEPISGDRINEMNLIRALSIYFDVYYNNVLVEPGATVFGVLGGKVCLPDKKYDLHYVRGNRDIFVELPNPKIWFATPYFPECFEQADAVAVMTEAWLEEMDKFPYDKKTQKIFGVNNQKVITPKKTILLRQVINHENYIVDESVSENYRKNLDGRLLIGHFGRVVRSNFPHHLIAAMKNENIPEKFSFIFSGKAPEGLKQWFHVQENIDQTLVASAIAACDATIYNQDEIGNFAGSLKVMESMALGVPIIATKLRAREIELGQDYPYFWSYDFNDQPWLDEAYEAFLSPVKNGYLDFFNSKVQKQEHQNIISRSLKFFSKTDLKFSPSSFTLDTEKLTATLFHFEKDAILRERVGNNLKARSLNFSAENVADSCQADLMKLI